MKPARLTVVPPETSFPSLQDRHDGLKQAREGLRTRRKGSDWSDHDNRALLSTILAAARMVASLAGQRIAEDPSDSAAKNLGA